MASLEVLRERMDAIARGIHSAVIREASALVLKAFAHPARRDPRVFFYLCLIKPFFLHRTALHDAFTLEHCFRKA